MTSSHEISKPRSQAWQLVSNGTWVVVVESISSTFRKQRLHTKSLQERCCSNVACEHYDKEQGREKEHSDPCDSASWQSRRDSQGWWPVSARWPCMAEAVLGIRVYINFCSWVPGFFQFVYQANITTSDPMCMSSSFGLVSSYSVDITASSHYTLLNHVKHWVTSEKLGETILELFWHQRLHASHLSVVLSILGWYGGWHQIILIAFHCTIMELFWHQRLHTSHLSTCRFIHTRLIWRLTPNYLNCISLHHHGATLTPKVAYKSS